MNSELWMNKWDWLWKPYHQTYEMYRLGTRPYHSHFTFYDYYDMTEHFKIGCKRWYPGNLRYRKDKR